MLFPNVIIDSLTQSSFQASAKPVPKLQAHILSELTRPSRERLMFVCNSGSDLDLRRDLCKHLSRFGQLSMTLLWFGYIYFFFVSVPSWSQDESSLEHLPPVLSYHITLVNLLAACAAGAKNVSIVEAKLQSIYTLDKLLDGLLDESLVIEVHLALLRFLREAFFNKKVLRHGMEQSTQLWLFFSSLTKRFEEIFVSVRRCSPGGTKVAGTWGYYERLKLQFIFEAVGALRAFFSLHFVNKNEQHSSGEEARLFSSFRDSEKESDDDVDVDDDVKVRDALYFQIAEEKKVIESLLRSLQEFLDVVGPWVSDRYLADVITSAEIIAHKSQMKKFQGQSVWQLPSGVCLNDLEASRLKPHGVWTAGSTSINSCISDSEIRLDCFSDFVTNITRDKALIAQAENDVVSVAKHIDGLPLVSDRSELGDLRSEHVISGLVHHIRSSMRPGSIRGNRYLDNENTVLAIWVMQLFRRLIESRWGMDIDSRDRNGGDEQDRAGGAVQSRLNNNGATDLCLEVIAPGIDKDLKVRILCLKISWCVNL
jgi:hypothetical protein